MSTNLATQLATLQSTQNHPRSLDKKTTFSLLFDFKTAANFGYDTIYALALDGYNSLLRLDNSFSQYGPRFFPSSSFNGPVIRENLTEVENKMLSLEIKDLLLRLSLYFLQDNAKKILEFLIKTYEIHRYESEELIICYMAYHSNNEYLKLLQNINLLSMVHWVFLEEIVKTGDQKITRNHLIKQIEKDHWILETLLKNDIKLWKLLEAASQTQEILYSMQEKALKKSDPVSLQAFHRFSMALVLEILKTSEKLRKNSHFLTIVLNYSGDLLKISQFQELKLSSIMIISEIFELDIPMNKEIVEIYVKDLIKEMKEIQEKDLLFKIIKFFIFLFQKKLLKNGFPIELIQVMSEKQEIFHEIMKNCKYNLMQFFFELFKKILEINDISSDSFSILEGILSNIAKNQDSSLKKTFEKELFSIFFKDLLEKNDQNIDFHLEIYQKIIKKDYFSQFNQHLMELLSFYRGNIENHDILMKFIKNLEKKSVSLLDNQYIESENFTIPISLGLLSQESSLKLKSLQKINDILEKPHENSVFSMEFIKILMISLKNEKKIEIFDLITNILSNADILEHLLLEDIEEILKDYLEFIKSQSNLETNLCNIINSSIICLFQKVEKSMVNFEKKNFVLVFVIFYEISKKSQNQEISSKITNLLKKNLTSYLIGNQNPILKIIDLINFENFENFTEFLENIIILNKYTFLEVVSHYLSKNKLINSQKIMIFLKKHKNTIYSCEKQQKNNFYGNLVKFNHFQLLNIALCDKDPETIKFLSYVNDKNIIYWLMTEESGTKDLKILVFLNNLVSQNQEMAKKSEFMTILFMIFLLNANRSSIEERKLWVFLMENIRNSIGKMDKSIKNQVFEVKTLDFYFNELKSVEKGFIMQNFSLKELKKLIKITLKSKFSLISNNENISKTLFSEKNRVSFHALVKYLNQNIELLPNDVLIKSYLSLISHESELFSTCLPFLRRKISENDDFYENYLNFSLEFKVNENCEDFLEISDILFKNKNNHFSSFINLLSHRKNQLFSQLSEDNQCKLVSFLLKSTENIEYVMKYLQNDINLDENLIISLLKSLKIPENLNSLELLFEIISAKNLKDIRIYKELMIILENLSISVKSSKIMLSIFRCLNGLFINIYENHSILFDFKLKKTPKQYEISITDLMGSFQENKSYKNIEICEKVLKSLINSKKLKKYGTQPIMAQILLNVLEFIANLANISYKESCKIVEKLLNSMVKIANSSIQFSHLSEITGFFAEKLLKNKQNVTKIKQFLIISVKCLYKAWGFHQKNLEFSRIFEEKLLLILKIYKTENLSHIILIFLSEILKEKEENIDKKEIFNDFLRTLIDFIKTNKFETIEFLTALIKLFHFLKEMHEKANKSKEKSILSKKDLFLLRKLFTKTEHNYLRVSIKTLLNLITQIIKSLSFQRLLERKLRESLFEREKNNEFESVFSSLFAEILDFEHFSKKNLKKTVLLEKKKKQLVFKEKAKKLKNHLKNVHNQCSVLLEFVENLIPLDFFIKITDKCLNRVDLSHHLKALILKGFHSKLLSQNKEKLDFLSSKAVFQSILQEITAEDQNNEKLAIFQIGLIVLIQLLSKLRKDLLKNNELFIHFEKLMTLLQHKKRIIRALLICFLSEISAFNQFSNEITINLKKIIEEMLNILKLDFKIEKNQQIFSLILKATNSFIINLNILINPYLKDIISHVFLIKPKHFLLEIDNIISNLSNGLPSRNLYKPIFEILSKEDIYQSSNLFFIRLNKLLEGLLNNIDNETFQAIYQELYKIFIKIFDFSKIKYVDKEKYKKEKLEFIERSLVMGFQKFAIKCNEVQLKKHFLAIVNWSDKKFIESDVGFGFIHYRKCIVYQIMFDLSQKMGQYFVPYYNYIFEFSLSFLNEFSSIFSKEAAQAKKLSKRSFQHPFEYYSLTYDLNTSIIQNLSFLFELDKEEFIDTQKFEKLIEVIPKQFDAIFIESYLPPIKYPDFIENNIKKLLINLMELMNDDYKWKSLHYALLLKTRSEENKLRLAIIHIIEAFIEHFKERYVVLINDLLPFLNEMLDDLDPEIEKTCKNIVVRLEKVSGEDIRDYLKKL